MIIFKCPKCGKRFGVADNLAGCSAHCNQCSTHIIIPDPEIDPAPESPDELLTAEEIFAPARPAAIQNPHEELAFGMVEESSASRACLPSNLFESEPKNKAPLPFEDAVENPKWYWPFIFPFSSTGLGMIVLFILCRIVIFLTGVIILRSIAITLVIFACYYLFWYLSACIHTTVKGRVKPPVILFEDKDDLEDKMLYAMRILLTIAAGMGPAILYFFATAVFSDPENIANIVLDMIFWSFLLFGQFFLPMMLLSIILIDSLVGLNPTIIFQAIRNTWWSYLRLFLYFSILIEYMITLLILAFIWSGTGLDLCALALLYYLCIVSAAILGRFFYKNERRLNWEV